MVQTPLHAQLGPASHHNSSSATMNGRASFGAKSGLQAMGLSGNFVSGGHHNHLKSIHLQHHGSMNSSNGISATNYSTSNHHQNYHLGHNLHRNRHSSATAAAVAAVAAVSLNSHFPHSHFSSSNLSQNSHHHHQLSLSSNSSAMSSASSTSSSPSASISPSSLTLSLAPQSNLASIGFHQSGGGGNSFHGDAHHVIENSHHLSPPQQQQPQQQSTSRYKTELCRPFEENGTCKYGEKCQFAHGLSELRTLTRHPKYKTEFCRTFHTTGFCPYGPRCHFIHNSKTPPTQAQLGLNSYSKLPFGHHTSHSASPSTSPISSTSSATTTNGSLSSSESTTSSCSPPSSSRLLDVVGPGFPYRTMGAGGNVSNTRDVGEHASFNQTSSSRRNENEDISHSPPCTSETQRLLWLHSHMNEGSRWPPAMCAGGLIGSSNARRTWQMQA